MKIPFFKKYKSNQDPAGNYSDGLYFIHIPKTGGTSIAKSIGLKRYSHIKAQEVIDSGNKKLITDNYSFAVVRNPFDRFFSLYSYARRPISYFHNNIQPEHALYGRHLDFELLKNATVEECAEYLVANRLKHDLSWNHWQPQYTWIYQQRGQNLLIDKVYKLENLEELKNDINEILGREIDIPHLNKSTLRHFKFNKRTLDLLEQYYEKDFSLFEY